ncbi:MAG: hypothetical protein OXI27_10070 [Thaumarchaeota archaeon]|nr:hypothetical protein [Nitrososphaerota archaeon]MDE0526910.1 hypothetical protein [Nitrososphaerota archaeon]
MLDVYADIAGNKFSDGGKKLSGDKGRAGGGGASFDTVVMPRAGMAKSRQLVRTESGAEVGINLSRGRTLRHGDILQSENPKRPPLIIKQSPEKVIVASFQARDPEDNHGMPSADDYFELCLVMGHVIGNRHRPISVNREESTVSFPIQDDSELETFERLLGQAGGDVELKIASEIFVPHAGADVHGHQ